MLIINDATKNLVATIKHHLSALSFHMREYYWFDMKKIEEIYLYKTEEYSNDAVNKAHYTFSKPVPAVCYCHSLAVAYNTNFSQSLAALVHTIMMILAHTSLAGEFDMCLDSVNTRISTTGATVPTGGRQQKDLLDLNNCLEVTSFDIRID
ncbi:hypothetical protein VNO77_23773 [Canavalia gladiata]|uniref:Uncharacterized protein n=1 Tax=Canavalia gladiata TaxID=3824 RepID=A0AAN9LAA1_CANGL